MAKQFIVRLKKSDGSIVANSQIITVNGIGDGAILASDFTDGLLTGSVTTTSRSGSFIKVIAAPVVTTYTPVITPTTATVGQSIQVAITGGPPNQTVTYRKKGSVNNMFGSGYVAGTWIPGTLTLDGSGAYTDGAYAFPIDGIATYEFTFPTGATWAIGGLNPKTHTITVSAASALTFTITPNVSAVNEGGTIGWTIANNAPFTYGTSGRWVKAYAYGTNINGDDVTEDVGDMEPLSEAILFTASGGVQWPGTFLSMTHITADAVTEGAEVIYGNITTWLNGSAESYVAAGTSTGVTINDTSTTPAGIPTITYPTTSTHGTPFTWSITGAQPNEGWFANTTGAFTARIPSTGYLNVGSDGSVTYNDGDWGSISPSNVGAVTVNFYFQTSGAVVTKSHTVSAAGALTFTITANVSSVNEGGTIGWTIANNAPFTYGTSGRWVRSWGSGTISGADLVYDSILDPEPLNEAALFTTENPWPGIFQSQTDILADLITEGVETLSINVTTWLNGSVESYVAAGTGPSVTINDTSTTPSALTFTITANVSSVNEGGTIGWTLSNNAPFTLGTSGRWVKAYVYGTNINGDDVTEDVGDIDPLSEAILFTASGENQWIGSSFPAMTVITADAVTEGVETIYANVTTWLNGSAESYVAAGTSTGVTINDTSTTPTSLSVNIVSSSVSRNSSPSWNTQHSGSGLNGGGTLYYSGGAGGEGPFWLADQSQSANHVYLVDARIPAGRTAGIEWPTDPDRWRTWYATDGTTAVSDPTQAIYVQADVSLPTSFDNKNNILNSYGFALSNWGISSGGFIITDNDTGLGLPNSNQSCRIIGTPYVFLGLHYGLNSVQIAVGTKLGEAGAGTATAISISLYEADGTTLVSTVSNPFHTYIPAPNSAGWNGTAYVNNVCWETTGYDQSTSGTYRSNWVDVGQTNNNNSDGSSIVGQIRIRLGSRAPFVLKIEAGHI